MQSNMNNQDSSIPVIDISGFTESTKATDMTEIAECVASACKDTGFFFLKPSLRTQRSLSTIIDATRHFFNLPLPEKQKLNYDATPTTWFRAEDTELPGTGPGYRGIGADYSFLTDTRESFNFGNESVVNNKWPDNDVVAKEWRELINECAKSYLSTCIILRRLMALALGQDMMVFEQPGYFDKSTWLLSMVHYFRDISKPQQGIHGIRPHCDGGIFTLLVRDGQPGLQMCPDKSKPVCERTWIDVPQAPTAHFTVNLGKNLERLSNGIFKATLHRVINRSGNERYSSVLFYDTNIDTILVPFPECCVKFPAKYAATTPGKLSIERLTADNERFE